MSSVVVTQQSWFSRIIGSLVGVLVGLAMFAGSFFLLFWNEGRAVRTAKSLTEGAAAVVHVPAEAVDASHQGKLVHVTGDAKTDDTVQDPAFGVSAQAIRLVRDARMYQWVEHKKEEKRTKLGGGTETVTTYTYSKEWEKDAVDSGRFHVSEGHENPSEMPFAGQSWTAAKVTLGAFRLNDAQKEQMDRTEDLPVTEKMAEGLPEEVAGKAKVAAGAFYVGADPASPKIGDEKVAFKVVRPARVSLVSKQVGDTFEPYQAEAGDSIQLLQYGDVSADLMFKHAQDQNTVLTWILRFVGWLVMLIGISLVMRPISVFADVVPFFGSIAGVGIALVAALGASAISMVVIAVAWIFYRPLLGILLLAGALAAVVGGLTLVVKKSRERAAAQVPKVA